jgi:hypothetical protein
LHPHSRNWCTNTTEHAASYPSNCVQSFLLHAQYLKQLDSLAADVDRFVGAGRQAPMRFITEGSTDRQTQIAAEETDRAALELKVKQSAHANEALSAAAQQALKELRALGDDCCPEIDLADIALEQKPLGSGRYGEPLAAVL